MENIIITRWEYRDMVKKEERIKTVKRLLDAGQYLSDKEIRIILDIEEEEEDEDGSF